MDLGCFTACLTRQPFDKIAGWAANHGFTALEVACWPCDNTRDFSATTIDVEVLTPDEAAGIKETLAKRGLRISSLGYYDNNLHCEPELRKSYHAHLRKVIDAAKILDVELVGTFIGRDTRLSLEDNFEAIEGIFAPIVRYAEEHGRKIMIENCPMVGWQEPGLPGNLAYSPELWDRLFDLIPSDSFGLNIDPSHLIWLGIDYIKVLREYRKKIFHAHAKDAQLLADGMYRYGIFGSQFAQSHNGDNFWQPRLPGQGDVRWKDFISTLYEVGLGDCTLSIEHEDPVWSGSEEKVKTGLILAAKHVSQFMV